MANIQVVSKKSHKILQEVSESNVKVTEPSVVVLTLSDKNQVKEIIRVGNNAIVVLVTGEKIEVVDFFIGENGHNSLVIKDSNNKLFWAKFDQTGSFFSPPSYETLSNLEPLLIDGSTTNIWPWAAGAAVIGGIAAAAGGGGGGSGENPQQNALNLISNAANNNSATSSNITLSVYAQAGVQNVTESNLNAVNDALNTNLVNAQAVDTVQKIQAVVDSYNKILAEANGSVADISVADPTAADYAAIGASIGLAASDAEN